MAKPDFSIKRGDTLPALRLTLRFEDGTPFDLTGIPAGSIYLNMQVEDQSVAAVTGAGSFAIVTAASGIVDYAWAAADTNTVGRYRAEVEVDTGSGHITFPNSGDLLFDVVADLRDGP